jgi:glycosyltransferase involved in cell wall biosynthesis
LHREASQFVISVKHQYPEFFSGKKVLEVGSLDINGSVRKFFTDCMYHGIDLGEGPGVDAVKHVTQVRGNDLWDVVISTEALEHDSRWDESLRQMCALLKPGGLMVITCAGPTRAEHGTRRTDGGWASPSTPDYYRNISTEDFASILPANLFSKSYLGYRTDHADLYFAGIKQVAQALPEVVTSEYKSYLLDTPTLEAKLRPTVTVEVSTLNRYFTTLPITIASIAMQTWKPDRLVIYDDGEQNELREIEPYTSLFRMLNDLGIPFETFKTPRLGLAANHQHALEDARTDFILRVDDDHLLGPRTIEELMRFMTEDEKVGAVAPLVHHPGNVQPLPQDVKGTVDDVFNGVNLQWYQWNSGPRAVDHLYSCYLYRVKAAKEAGGYPILSPVSFREDTWFSMKIARAGYKLIVTPYTKVHHLQQQTGGIRAFSDGSLWDADDKKWREWLASAGVEDKSPKLLVGDFGIGDTFALKSVLPQLKERHKERGLVIAVSHLGILEDEGVPLISIGEAQQRLGARFEESSIYSWMGRRSWKRPITEAMLEFWQ